MNHHRLAFIALATSIFCTPKAICQNAKEQLKTKQPNIIFILADDLGYGDLGVFLQKQREKVNNRSEPFTFTPNLDRMAANGAIMPQHYCAAPVSALKNYENNYIINKELLFTLLDFFLVALFVLCTRI